LHFNPNQEKKHGNIYPKTWQNIGKPINTFTQWYISEIHKEIEEY